MIETERLLLRNWRESDIPVFIEHTNTPAVMRWLGGVRPQERLEHIIRDKLMVWQEELGFTFWAVERKEDAAFLGFCGLIISEVEGSSVIGSHEIGWRLREDAWGQGYAKEAAAASLDHGFTRMAADHVVAQTVKENAASWGLMERLGMSRRADLDYHDPEWGNNRVIIYRIERAEWLTRGA
jgi:RimJ/RimL family protein N-acetyltransferase